MSTDDLFKVLTSLESYRMPQFPTDGHFKLLTLYSFQINDLLPIFISNVTNADLCSFQINDLLLIFISNVTNADLCSFQINDLLFIVILYVTNADLCSFQVNDILITVIILLYATHVH